MFIFLLLSLPLLLPFSLTLCYFHLPAFCFWWLLLATAVSLLFFSSCPICPFLILSHVVLNAPILVSVIHILFVRFSHSLFFPHCSPPDFLE